MARDSKAISKAVRECKPLKENKAVAENARARGGLGFLGGGAIFIFFFVFILLFAFDS